MIIKKDIIDLKTGEVKVKDVKINATNRSYSTETLFYFRVAMDIIMFWIYFIIWVTYIYPRSHKQSPFE